MYSDFRIMRWTATEISKSRSCHGGEAKGKKERKETHLRKKVTLAALSILLWFCIRSRENETDELWNYSVILWSSIIWNQPVFWTVSCFCKTLWGWELLRANKYHRLCHLKHTWGDNSQDFQLHKTRHSDWVRSVSWWTWAHHPVRQRLTQLSMRFIVLASTSLWLLYSMPGLIDLYLLFTS